jgi:hypothetical protein
MPAHLILLVLITVIIIAGAHTASHPMCTAGSSSGIKRQGRETDHSPSSRDEVKNAWSYTFTPQYFFIAWYLVRTKENFTSTSSHYALFCIVLLPYLSYVQIFSSAPCSQTHTTHVLPLGLENQTKLVKSWFCII